ncbi:MAG: hypothetical protein SOZ75_03925 [Candidatus Enterosoma sp.]|nr:hypothetical protein [Candidatus Enterosoma sp.]
MKKMNKSKVVGVAAVSLAAVSLIGVGFANWIVGGITGTPTSGQVTVAVGEVTDNRIDFSASGDNVDLSFDCNGKKTNPFKSSEDTKLEDLSFSIKYSLASTADESASKLPVPVNVKIELSGPFMTFMDSHSTYVSLTTPDGFTKSETGYTYTTTNSISTKQTDTKVIFTFGWGSAFLTVNPADITQEQFDANNGVTITSVKEALVALKGAAGPNVITAKVSALAA